MFCKHDWVILDKTETESLAARAFRLCIEVTSRLSTKEMFW